MANVAWTNVLLPYVTWRNVAWTDDAQTDVAWTNVAWSNCAGHISTVNDGSINLKFAYSKSILFSAIIGVGGW